MAALAAVIVDSVVTPFLVPILIWGALAGCRVERASFGLVLTTLALKAVLKYQLMRGATRRHG